MHLPALLLFSMAESYVVPVTASPEIWLGPRGHADFYNFSMKLFAETAETDSSSKEFQTLITRSV